MVAAEEPPGTKLQPRAVCEGGTWARQSVTCPGVLVEDGSPRDCAEREHDPKTRKGGHLLVEEVGAVRDLDWEEARFRAGRSGWW